LKILRLFFAFSLLVSAQEILTNESVAKMVKAGLGEGLIISMIQNQPGKYSMTPDELVKLKQEGVPEKVLAAMLSKGVASAPGGASPASPSIAPPSPQDNGNAQGIALKNIRKVFIDKMDNDLDQYLRAEIVKQFKGKRVS
jgi:hypothetical protein